MDRCRNGPGFHNDIDGNSTIQEILIPASKVGLVIGKGGETIKQLQVCEPLAEQRFNGPPGIGGKGLVLTQTTPPPGLAVQPSVQSSPCSLCSGGVHGAVGQTLCERLLRPGLRPGMVPGPVARWGSGAL